MRRAILVFLLLSIGLSTCLAAEPELISESAVLIDADTGQVLFNKEMDKKMFPASITKILTCLVAIENSSLDDKIVMSHDAVFSVGRGASHISLDVDECITMRDALYAAALVSANDACNGIAERISGSISDFTVLMNERAKKAGAAGSHFNNTNGLKDDEHYTTAHDMALIMRDAIENPTFCEIFGALKYDMAPNNVQPETRHFFNQHSMLSPTDYTYEGVFAGKAGYTTQAKFTLVTAAERNGIRLIAVVMKSPRVNDKYLDTAALFNYGFSEFKRVEIEADKVSLPSGIARVYLDDRRAHALVPVGNTDRADIESSFEAGSVIARLSNAERLTLPCRYALAAEPIELEEGGENQAFVVLRFFGAIVGILICVVALLIFGIWLRKKVHKLYRSRRRKP